DPTTDYVGGPPSYVAVGGHGCWEGYTPGPELFEVQTFYERMFLSQGYKITYMAFTIDHEGPYRHPETFDSDYWRSIEGPRRFSHSPEATQR
ncbi:MAG: hypothetical protein IJ205_02115, partial [Bacteroidales bacterium]|nr:hypothetical protein [Bacteroidales bacterium]